VGDTLNVMCEVTVGDIFSLCLVRIGNLCKAEGDLIVHGVIVGDTLSVVREVIVGDIFSLCLVRIGNLCNAEGEFSCTQSLWATL
jgi:hypothetical protein